MPESNPFLSRRFEVQWSRLTPDQIVPGIETALDDALGVLEAIATQDRSAVTFESTVEALESATDVLDEAWGKVSHLAEVCDSAEFREAYNTMLPRVSEFYASIHLNGALWDVMRAFASAPEASSLGGIKKRLFDETIADFKQAGAGLDVSKKTRLEQIESDLARLTQKYSENVLDATKAWELVVSDESRIEGLPRNARAAALNDAIRKGYATAENPKWRFTLQQPSMEPVLAHAVDESLRREVWEAVTAVGARAPHDNHGSIPQILRLRAEKASILGKKSFPDLVLERRMAKTGSAALDFVEDLHRKIKAAFDSECAELEDFKAAKTGKARAPLAPWETAFWAEKLRKERYDFDDEQLRPYFPLGQVLEGLFALCERIFGVRAIARPKGVVEVWHPDVCFYDLVDADGRPLGSFYTDWHPRESKRSGAWMDSLITGAKVDGRRHPHLGLMCGNITPASGETPALLKHREVETVFHEFGHLLHHLLGDVEYKSLNGTRVPRDFVELPSQIMENWTWEREGLDLIGRHYETGERIPDALFGRMIAARNFRAATSVMRQLCFGKMDLEMHLHPERFGGPELDQAIEAALVDYMVPTVPVSPPLVFRFGHLFSHPTGYAGGYYSYKWSEVLEADAFTRFKESGIMSEETGMAFRKHVLSRGNSEPVEMLFRRFMGREPDPQALLIRAGLA